jgi:small GTP-binding protein
MYCRRGISLCPLADPRCRAVSENFGSQSANRFKKWIPVIMAKVILLGATGVGKTAVYCRILEDTFDANTLPTVTGQSRTVEHSEGGHTATFVFWDTAGQEKYRALTSVYYRDAAAAVLVFALDSRESFDAISTRADASIIVLGNKSDLADRAVTYAEGEARARDLDGSPYVEASAKTSDGIKDLLTAIHITVREITAVHQLQAAPAEAAPKSGALCK